MCVRFRLLLFGRELRIKIRFEIRFFFLDRNHVRKSIFSIVNNARKIEYDSFYIVNWHIMFVYRHPEPRQVN